VLTPGPRAIVADMSEKLNTVKVDTVSLPIALGLWLMMWPVLTKVRGLLVCGLSTRSHWQVPHQVAM
jgi:hypothetical protein